MSYEVANQKQQHEILKDLGQRLGFGIGDKPSSARFEGGFFNNGKVDNGRFGAVISNSVNITI